MTDGTWGPLLAPVGSYHVGLKQLSLADWKSTPPSLSSHDLALF